MQKFPLAAARQVRGLFAEIPIPRREGLEAIFALIMFLIGLLRRGGDEGDIVNVVESTVPMSGESAREAIDMLIRAYGPPGHPVAEIRQGPPGEGSLPAKPATDIESFRIAVGPLIEFLLTILWQRLFPGEPLPDLPFPLPGGDK